MSSPGQYSWSDYEETRQIPTQEQETEWFFGVSAGFFLMLLKSEISSLDNCDVSLRSIGILSRML